MNLSAPSIKTSVKSNSLSSLLFHSPKTKLTKLLLIFVGFLVAFLVVVHFGFGQSCGGYNPLEIYNSNCGYYNHPQYGPVGIICLGGGERIYDNYIRIYGTTFTTDYARIQNGKPALVQVRLDDRCCGSDDWIGLKTWWDCSAPDALYCSDDYYECHEIVECDPNICSGCVPADNYLRVQVEYDGSLEETIETRLYIQTTEVQCCDDSDCGANAYCDSNHQCIQTCKTSGACTSDSEACAGYECCKTAIQPSGNTCCGEDGCEAGETCSNCAADCSACPVLTFSASPSTVSIGQTITLTSSATDDTGLNRIGASYGGSWHYYSCGDATSCSNTWTTSESTAGTYQYCGYAEDTNGQYVTTSTCPQVTVSSCKSNGATCSAGSECCSPGICNIRCCAAACPSDGWFNVGDVYGCCSGDSSCVCQDQQYRDYYCDASGGCAYTVTGTQTVTSSCVNCNNYDGCAVYGTGCEDRDYYCSGAVCNPIVSNRNTDYFAGTSCADDNTRNGIFHDYYCTGVTCTDHTSAATEDCVNSGCCLGGNCMDSLSTNGDNICCYGVWKKNNGASCNVDSDCCSAHCAADYDGAGKWCAPTDVCLHNKDNPVIGWDFASSLEGWSFQCPSGVSWCGYVSSEGTPGGCMSGNSNPSTTPPYSKWWKGVYLPSNAQTMTFNTIVPYSDARLNFSITLSGGSKTVLYDQCEASTGGWQGRSIDVSSLAGQDVMLEFAQSSCGPITGLEVRATDSIKINMKTDFNSGEYAPDCDGSCNRWLCAAGSWTSLGCAGKLCSGGSCTATCSQACGANCDANADCACGIPDGCYIIDGGPAKYYDFPDYGLCKANCNCDTLSSPGSPCEPTIVDCSVQNPATGYCQCTCSPYIAYNGENTVTGGCTDGKDNDCDGSVDSIDPDCDQTLPVWSNNYTVPLSPTNYTTGNISFQITWSDNKTGIWWNKSFTKRKPITISNTGGALTNYQIGLTVDYDSDMQSDFDDLRFADSSNNELKYWIESYVASTNAKVWVKVPSIPASGTTIYMYYGNTSVANVSNGSYVFDFYDGFDTYIDGNLGGQGGWYWISDPAHPQAQIQGATTQGGSAKAVQINYGDHHYNHSIPTSSTGSFIFYMRRSFPRGDMTTYLNSGPTTYVYGIRMKNDNHFNYWTSAGAWANLPIDTTWSANTWYKIEIAYNAASDTYVSIKISDVEKGSNVAAVAADTVDNIHLYMAGIWQTDLGPQYWDTFRITKYASPGPTSSFGSEDSYPGWVDTFKNAIFEFNGLNYTSLTAPAVYNNTNNVYWINFTSQPVGSYSYRWLGYDVNGNVNSTPRLAYVIQDVVPPVTDYMIVSGVRGKNGWFISPVTIRLAPYDLGGDGVGRLYYNITNMTRGAAGPVNYSGSWSYVEPAQNPGKIFGATRATGVGVYGLALSFDGLDDYVKVADDASLDITNAITIMGWVNISGLSILGPGYYGSFVGKGNDVMTPIFTWGTEFWLATGGEAYPDALGCSINWNRDHWYHIAYVYDGNNRYIYVNGSLCNRGTKTGAINVNDEDMFIANSSSNQPFNGTMDNIKIYNRALAQEEIVQNMNNNVTMAGMVMWHRYDENAGAVATDTSASIDLVLGTQGMAQVRFYSVDEMNNAETEYNQEEVVTTVGASFGNMPTGLSAMPFYSTMLLQWDAYPDSRIQGFAIYRRAGGESYGNPSIYVGDRNHVTDFNLQPGKTYYYRIAAIDSNGTIGNFSDEISTTTITDSTLYSKHSTLHILVVFYTGGNETLEFPPITSQEIQKMKKGLEVFREFYWRNTKGKLNLDFTYLEIADKNFYSDPREKDLVERKIVRNDQYDGVFLIGNDGGCWAGGGLILGHTTLAVGRICGVPYPAADDPNVDRTIAWHYTHEFGHNVDGFFAEMSGYPDYPSSDIEPEYAKKPPGVHFDAGTHYDWIANALRSFYYIFDNLASPWGDYIETRDSDDDNFPDQDFRVPIDENRFGSSTSKTDTDSDGLSDLEEMYAGIFAGSNPTKPDTDNDGIVDGSDLYPLSSAKNYIIKFTPVIDGSIEPGWLLYTNDYFYSDVHDLDSKIYSSWDNNSLYFAADVNKGFTFHLRVDGSGTNGFFEGGDSYDFRVDTTYKKVYVAGKNLSPHGGSQQGVSQEPAGASVATSLAGGRYIMEAAIPKNLIQGYGLTGENRTNLNLTEGNVLGFSIVLGSLNGDGNKWDMFSGDRAYVFEPYRFYDVILRYT